MVREIFQGKRESVCDIKGVRTIIKLEGSNKMGDGRLYGDGQLILKVS